MIKKYLKGTLVFVFCFVLVFSVSASAEKLNNDLDFLEDTIYSLGRILKINLPEREGTEVTVVNESFDLKNAKGVVLTKNLKQGDKGSDVKWLQVVLNADTATVIAKTGLGSPGNESDYFGPATLNAVKRFQQKYKSEVLAPANLSYPTGYVGSLTRNKINAILSGAFTIVPSEPPVLPTPPASTTKPSTPSTGTGKAPNAPTVYEINKNSVTVSGEEDTEVKLDATTEWQTSPAVFSNLQENTSYSAYARYKATATASASKTSEATAFKTATTNPCRSQRTITDQRNRKVYQVVEIGSQCWMAENLNYDIDGSWYYNNSKTNGDKHGRLYTFEVAKTACPSGWRLPTDNDFKILESYLGMERLDLDKTGWRADSVGSLLKSNKSWDGNNEKDFNALPSGGREESGSFSGLEQGVSFWTSTESGNFVWIRNLFSNRSGINRILFPKENAVSIRCIRDL